MTPRSFRSFAERLRDGFPLVDQHPDIAGLLCDAAMLAELGPALAAPFGSAEVTKVIAPEARGPVLGALVAVELGCGLVLARKQGRNHPGADVVASTAPSWHGNVEVFQARSFDINPDDRVVMVDDWVTTGNSLRALRALVAGSGATDLGATVIVNKAVESTLDELRVRWLVRFDQISGAQELHR